jgi:hypothetical protein
LIKTILDEKPSASRVFFQSEVAALLEMPDSLIKSWTIGRPLRITPQRRATGSGTRNLYGREDLYRFAIAKHLSMDGFASHAIQFILDALGNQLSSAGFAIVSGGSKVTTPWRRCIEPKVHLVASAEFEKKRWTLANDPANDSMCFYFLNIRAIVSAVDVRVEGASKRGVATTRSPKKRSESPSRSKRVFLNDES